MSDTDGMSMRTLLEILSAAENQEILMLRLKASVEDMLAEAHRALLPAQPPVAAAACLPLPASAAPREVMFLLKAAAAGEPHGPERHAFNVRSVCGMWTLEVFEGVSEEGVPTGLGTIMLTVAPEHQGTYEGLIARVFVREGDSERTLLEQRVHHGQLRAQVRLEKKGLRNYAAISVVFSAPSQGP